MTDAQLYRIKLTDRWKEVSYVVLGSISSGIKTTPWANEAWRCTRATAEGTAKNVQSVYRTRFKVEIEEARQ